jgi:dTDP-4-dehydrorhamnose 3,5-epimerase
MAFFTHTEIPGLIHFQQNSRFDDERGSFSKPLHLDFLTQHKVDFECRESFISFSKHNVLRGLHFQTPPYAHDKIVSCLDGSVFDVVIDLRVNLPTYGKILTFNLHGSNNESLVIPAGCAHGFKVTSSQGAWMAYFTSKEYAPANDQGVVWSSLDLTWPGDAPVVSSRDQSFKHWKDADYFK